MANQNQNHHGNRSNRKHERVQIKLEFLRMITRLKLDPARMQLIVGFFETYLRLDEQEAVELEATIQQLQPREEQIMELCTSWEIRGMEKGKLEGELEGECLAKLGLGCKLLMEGLLSI